MERFAIRLDGIRFEGGAVAHQGRGGRSALVDGMQTPAEQILHLCDLAKETLFFFVDLAVLWGLNRCHFFARLGELVG